MLRLNALSARFMTIPGLTLAAMIAVGAPLAAQDADAPGEPSTQSDATESETEPAEEAIPPVPEGKDAKTLQEFLNKLTTIPAKERSPAGFRDHFKKLYDLSQEVLARDVDDETSLMAVAIMAGSLDILEQFGDQAAVQRRLTMLEGLKKSARPALAAHARLLEVQGQIARLDTDDKAAVKAVIDQVSQLLKDKPLTIDHGRIAYGAISVLERTGDTKLVGSAAETFAKLLKASDDETLTSLANTLEGSARRLNLKGNPLKIAATTLAGEEFNIDQWKGKVVIVDFWATWCGPCVAEMPALKQLYEAQHENGLEIVGISLDDSRRQLEAFIEQRDIPWPTIFIDPQGKEAWDNPLATYYGVSAIPTAFLVGRDGKVFATDLYGDALTEAATELVEAK